MIENTQALWVTGGAVSLLLLLVLKVRMAAFPALLLTSLAAAIAAGMTPADAIETVKNGMGGTLGFIAIVVGLGSIFGTLLQAGGGVEALAALLLRHTKPAAIPLTLGLLGLIVAVPVFFDVALIILAPMVFGLAAKLEKPSIYLGLPLLAGLATAHAFVPPTPGPMAVADLLSADIGLVALFGAIAGVPAVLIAGPVWAKFAQARGILPTGTDQGMAPQERAHAAEHDPNLGRITLVVILLPLVLILSGTLAPLMFGPGSLSSLLGFAGHPFVALLACTGIAYILFRPSDKKARTAFRKSCERALEPAGAVILVTGAGGAFKQVLVDTGAGGVLASTVLDWGLIPVAAGFLLALLVRVAQGSATVAMITAAGLTAPIVEAAALPAAQTALTVVAIAAGASAMSHVNDSGFWLVSRYFGLSAAETLRTWTISSTLVGFVGFAVALVLTLIL